MAPITIDKRPALVLIDLQKGILALPTVIDPDEIKTRAGRLAAAFRASTLPVVRVKVAWSADGGDLPPGRALMPGPESAPPTAYSEFPEDFPPHPGDIVLVKRHWGAFTGTELDLQLRRRGVTQIVLAGISTSIGVESTARSAWENSYNLIFVEDAITDVDSASHAHTFTKIFPRLGEIATTEQIIDTLKGRSMDPAVGGSITARVLKVLKMRVYDAARDASGGPGRSARGPARPPGPYACFMGLQLGVDDCLLVKLVRSYSCVRTSGSWRRRWTWPGSWRRSSQSGRAHARASVRSQVARLGGPPPGLPRTRLGAHGAASLRCLAGRGVVADADLMKAC